MKPKPAHTPNTHVPDTAHDFPASTVPHRVAPEDVERIGHRLCEQAMHVTETAAITLDMADKADQMADQIASSGTARAAADAARFYELADMLREDEGLALALARGIEQLRN